MLNLPIGALVAASKAACVAPKSLPSSACFVHSPLLARYSRLSAFSMRMYMREGSPGPPDEKAASHSSNSFFLHLHDLVPQFTNLTLHPGGGCSYKEKAHG